MSKHLSDSSEQQTAEKYMLKSLEKNLGICFDPETALPIEVGVQPDAIDPINKVIVEAYARGTKGDGVEFRRFFFHLFVVMKSHATSSQNRCAGCLASYHMQGY